jgi:ABC-type multidrug transport system fused ATPase/permease subunit
LPDLVASAVAAVAVTPIVIATLPPRALGVAALAVTLVFGALVALGRVSARVQRRIWDASQKVLDQVAFAVEGRLELAARGAEDVAMRAVTHAVDDYRRTAKRGAWASAMLGRVPFAVGLLVVILGVLLDAAAREEVTAAILKQALVLAACLPILAGVVLRTNEVLRLTATLGPVLDVLAASRRPELARKGAPPPALPADVVARDVSFGYAPGSPLTLRELSFEWPAAGPLFIEGANGAGKSTLLRLLLGLRRPESGLVTVGAADLGAVDLVALRRSIAYLPQRPYLGESYTTLRAALRGVADDDVADGRAARRRGRRAVGRPATAARAGARIVARCNHLLPR